MALAAAPDNVVILSHYGRVLKLQRNFSGFILFYFLFSSCIYGRVLKLQRNFSGYNVYFLFLFLLHYGRDLKLQQTLSGVQKSDDSDFTQYLF